MSNDAITLERAGTADQSEKPADPNPAPEEVSEAITKAQEISEALSEAATTPKLSEVEKAASAEEPQRGARSGGAVNFDIPVTEAQRSWLNGRHARYLALYDAVPLVKLALANPDAWECYRNDQGLKGRTVEAQCFSAMTATDPEADEIGSTRAGVYANVIGFFAFNCAGMDASAAIDALKAVGAMEKAGELYRSEHPAHFTAKGGRRNPKRKKLRPGRPKGSGHREKQPEVSVAPQPPTAQSSREGSARAETAATGEAPTTEAAAQPTEPSSGAIAARPAQPERMHSGEVLEGEFDRNLEHLGVQCRTEFESLIAIANAEVLRELAKFLRRGTELLRAERGTLAQKAIVAATDIYMNVAA